MRKTGLVALLLLLSSAMTPARADVLYESATLGETGSWDGWGIGAYQFVGSRFTLEESAHVTAVGGHLFSYGTIFAAVLTMEGQLPLGEPFTDEELLAAVVFDAGDPSTDYRIALELELEAGDYALVFGSGLFGATGAGGMPHDDQVNTPEGAGSYFYSIDTNWVDGGIDNARFVVEGVIVPAPGLAGCFAGGLGVLALLGMNGRCIARRRGRG